MQFTRLWPLGLLIAIPILILLYMLKKQNQPKVVSSVFLWQEIYETTYADKPWQKFRKHILLILQILAILLLVFSLMTPQAPLGQSYYKNVIFVVDNSASMNALYKETTRLDAAKAWMQDYIEEAGEETKAYIITTGAGATLTLGGSSQKQNLLSSIHQITPSYTTAYIEEGVQMAKALGESLQESYEIIVLTDTKVEVNLEVGRYVYFGQSGLNGAITLMSHQATQEGMVVLVQVTNKGNQTYTGDLSLYVGSDLLGMEELFDVQEITLEQGESKTLHFNILTQELVNLGEVNHDISYLKGELSVKDALQEDNTYYYVPNQLKEKKILLVTQSNVFLEKALMTLENCEVYKTTDLALINSDEVYDLYVLDGQDMNLWPQSGNVLMINSTLNLAETKNTLVKELQQAQLNHQNQTENSDVQDISHQTKRVEGIKDNLPDYLSGLNFLTNQANSYKLPHWGKAILQTGDEVIGFMGDKNGQKVGVLGFDLWSSDFVLTTDFPLLIQYLGDELLDTARVSQYNFTSDETITLRRNDIEEEFKVKTLDGKQVELNKGQVSSSNYLGLYQVEVFNHINQHLGSSAIENTLIAVNYPSQKESDLHTELSGEEILGEAGSLKGNKNMTPYIIILLLGVVLTEWYFYRKGY